MSGRIDKGLQPKNEEENAIAVIAKELKPIAKDWNAKFDGNGAHDLGTRKWNVSWKQRLKNKFVQRTQFDIDDPYKAKVNWDDDLLAAFNQTVQEVCPNWKSIQKDRVVYDLIFDYIQKQYIENNKIPRAEWLQQRACSWLKSLSWSPGHPIYVAHQNFQPSQAIRVAYHIFLHGGGKFRSGFCQF